MRGIKAPPPVRAITDVTKTSGNVRINSTNHGFSTNNKVFISNVLGATQRERRLDNHESRRKHLHLNGTNGVSMSGYTSGTGTVYSFTAMPKSPNGYAIPPGAGITGHILIQIVDANGVARDVTTQSSAWG